MIEGFLGGAVLPGRSILIVCEALARRLQSCDLAESRDCSQALPKRSN